MNVRWWTVMHNRIFLAGVTFVAICWGGCAPGGTSVTVDPNAAIIESAMKPIAIAVNGDGGCDPASAANFLNNAAVFWLARCDEVQIRWSNYGYDTADLGLVNFCDPPRNASFAVIPPLSLFLFPGAMFGADEKHASYNAFSGCSTPVSGARPPPANLQFASGDRSDYVLELHAGEEPTGATGPASLPIARVTAPRQIARVLAQECRAQDGNGVCIEADYAWSVSTVGDGLRSEAFSQNLRISQVRVLQGRTADTPGVEGLIPGESGFACDIEKLQCISLPFEFIEPNARGAFRCAFNDSFDGENAPSTQSNYIHIRTGCRRGTDARTVDATPGALYVSGVPETPVVVWKVRFNAAAGFPLPAANKTIVLEFTLENL